MQQRSDVESLIDSLGVDSIIAAQEKYVSDKAAHDVAKAAYDADQAKPATEQEGLSDPGAAPVSPATLWDSLTKSITDGDVATRTALSATAAALTTAINSGDAATKAMLSH